MNEIIIYLAIFITGFIIIELIVRNIVKSINKDFQWLIIEKDEAPKLSKQGLEMFFWVRGPFRSSGNVFLVILNLEHIMFDMSFM